MNFYTLFFLKFILLKNRSFIWESKQKRLKIIGKIISIDTDLLIGIDRQKNTIINNTINFAKGNVTNNALLWGARGNGKSTLIKSVFNQISKDYKSLRLIQLNKNNIDDIELIYSIIRKFKDFRFIIFIDDLSFEKIQRKDSKNR